MKKIFYSIPIAAVVVTLATVMLMTPQTTHYETFDGPLGYVPSDITKANPDFKIAISSASYKTTDISVAKNTIIGTFRGTVTSIGEPIDWIGNDQSTYGAIPITIEVTKNAKDTWDSKFKKMKSFTFYVNSFKMDDGSYLISSIQPEFEIGEDVIVHINRAPQGPMGEGGDNYFVELGDFGKYKIDSDKAFNKKYPQGKNINAALSESN